MRKYIMALDQGTMSSRTLIFNYSGEIGASCSQKFDQVYPRPWWVEHNPNQIWHSQLKTIRGTLEQGHVGIRDISAIGITNQRETTAVWKRKTREPLYAVINRPRPYLHRILRSDRPRGRVLQPLEGLLSGPGRVNASTYYSSIQYNPQCKRLRLEMCIKKAARRAVF